VDIKSLVDKELTNHALLPYPGDYWNLDKGTITMIYHAVWRAMMEAHPGTDGQKLMVDIDNEVESRGYYLDGEPHNTPLIKTDPNKPVPEPKPEVPGPKPVNSLEDMVKAFITAVSPLLKK